MVASLPIFTEAIRPFPLMNVDAWAPEGETGDWLFVG